MYEGSLYDEAHGPSNPRSHGGFFPQSAGSWEETYPDVDFTTPLDPEFQAWLDTFVTSMTVVDGNDEKAAIMLATLTSVEV